MKKRSILKLAGICLPALIGAPSVVRAASRDQATIVMKQSGAVPIGWNASGFFTDGGAWTRHITFQGVGPDTYEAETAPTLYGALGAFRIDMQMHANTVQGTGLYGTWVLNSGNYLGNKDLPTGWYVNLRGQGVFSSSRDEAGIRIYILLGEVQLVA